MSSAVLTVPPTVAIPHGPVPGEPVWELAELYPRQGDWTESDYLALTTKRLVEFSDGFIEVLPMPKLSHQWIMLWLYDRLREFVAPRQLGAACVAPVPVHLRPQKYREPDVFFLSNDRLAVTRDYPEGVDLAMEVTSDGEEARHRDLVVKRAEYAAARVPEYWIIDVDLREITVLVLDGAEYRVHGVFGAGQSATSVLLDGFAVTVDAAFAAGAGPVPHRT